MIQRGFSAYLDLLRFGAAMVVIVSHFGYERFSEGRWLWVRELNLGSDAVVVFFVLSGFVIALVAERKGGGMRTFAFDRLTRLWSVALPALVLGYALDRLGAWVAPEVYADWFYNPLSLAEQLWRGLSFTNEWAGQATRLGTNGPFWSLSYEAAYYALFAVAFYLRGLARVVLIVALILAVGPNILLLAPAWLLGVGVWHAVKRGPAMRRGVAMILALGPVAGYAGALAMGAPEVLRGLSDPIMAVHDLRFSDEFVWNALLGALVATHLLGMAQLVRDARGVWAARAGWLAGGSFSLYLVHYPVMQALSVLLPLEAVGWAVRDALLLGLTIAVCFAFASLFERPLPRLRAALAALRRDRARVRSGWPAAPRSGPAR